MNSVETIILSFGKIRPSFILGSLSQTTKSTVAPVTILFLVTSLAPAATRISCQSLAVCVDSVTTLSKKNY
jgi:hypothetical protein